MKQIREKTFHNVTGTNKIEIESHGMVSNYMFYFQRSDVNLRNEWSNYSNWKYNGVSPSKNVLADHIGDFMTIDGPIGPGMNPNGTPTDLYTTNVFNPENEPDILTNLGILFDGTYREDNQPVGIYNFIEKNLRTNGNAPDGLYCYNFCLNSSSSSLNPSGAFNTSKVNRIEFEFTTIIPPADPLAQSLNICDPDTGEIVGVNKPTWRIYLYNYDLRLFEEKLN